ncbi:MAG: beta-galactosidase trimerization domain-containing protein [Bryobacteraceae bacterium]|nr:beta-galactosidase [Bryobacterales bacterium]MEB2360247.1 beta-galactosidase trimerization domain-containing protein [Bryobacterales bacterium]NUN03851.1 beta-galactosidase trimerization domain-containing protein [Bryobacteraceae bacterium]
MRSTILAFLTTLAFAGAALASVAVLEDFESATPSSRWIGGKVEVSDQQASHGRLSGRIIFEQSRSEIRLQPRQRDWRPFDRLLFDVYSDRSEIQTLSLRIYERAGGANPDGYFEARNKLVVKSGWNHIEVKLSGMQTASYQRKLSFDDIAELSLFCERVQFPWTIFVDNIRLVQGQEGATRSRNEPDDIVTTIENRWFTVRQVARPEEVPESDDVGRLRKEAQQQLDRLRETIRAAQVQGIDTIYAERHLVTAELGLQVRPRLPWFNNDADKLKMFAYVAGSCARGRRHLEDLIAGVVRLPHVDDTQVTGPDVPLYPNLKGLKSDGWFYRDSEGKPLMVISLHSPSTLLQRFFATPRQHIESYTVGGGSRWTIEESPVYEAFHKYPDTHRVGWDGWCGHLIRDLFSMGGSKMENVVICLESPHIRDAVDKYIRINIPKFHNNPQLLYDVMAYELMYICYCERSQKMFREWLANKHGTIARVNEIYGTSYTGFDGVVAPPVKNSRPLAGTNRALWYDWARFNQDRFTDYLLWVKSRVRAVDSTVPLAAGGSSSMLGGGTGTSGIDEERIVNEVGDLILHEGGGSTLGADLQMALPEQKKPLADPEMSLQSVYNLLPHALHGKSVMQFFHWPAQPQNEFFSMNASALPHSWRFSLAEVGDLIRATLDARRLASEIAAFVDAPPEVAILYSQTSTLQLPPEMLTWRVTPYLAELEKMYEGSRYLDAKTTFITERQAAKGWLSRYKLLLVPGVRNLPAGIVQKIWEFAESGGRVLITPESLLGDEYNRQQPFLSRLGIAIEQTRHPKPGTIGAMTQGYDQSFSQDVAFTSGSRQKLRVPLWDGMELETGGVSQKLRLTGDAESIANFSDGGAALARTRTGRGVIYYSAASLTSKSYWRLLDRIFQDANVTRPVRVRDADNPEAWELEARYVVSGKRRLLYVTSHKNGPLNVELQLPPKDTATLFDLRNRTTVESITLPSRETGIYELR